MADLFGPGFGIKINKQYKVGNRDVVELSDGRTMYADSPEYIALHKQGLLYGESPDKVVHKQLYDTHLEMDRYKIIEEENPFQRYVENYFQGTSGGLARGLGQSENDYENLPQSLKDDYDKDIHKKWASSVFDNFTQEEGENRGDYLNRITEGMNPKIVETLYKYLPSKAQPTYWEDAKRGLVSIANSQTGGDGEDYMRLLQNNSDLSTYEKNQLSQNLKDSPYLATMEQNMGAIAPLSIPGKAIQSIYRPEYSFEDAMQGRRNDAGMLEDLATDFIAGEGLVRGGMAVTGFGVEASKRASNISKLLVDEGVPLLQSQARGYVQGVKKGYGIPSDLERLVKPTSDLTRPQVKSLREIQSLSGLSLDRNIAKSDLYTKYLKSSLNDDTLLRLTGKDRTQIQESLDEILTTKKTRYSLYDEIDFPDAGNPRHNLLESNSPSDVEEFFRQVRAEPEPHTRTPVNRDRDFDDDNINSIIQQSDNSYLRTSENRIDLTRRNRPNNADELFNTIDNGGDEFGLLNDYRLTNEMLGKQKLGVESGIPLGRKLREFFPPRGTVKGNPDDFVPMAKNVDTEEVNSLLPRLFKKSGDDVMGDISRAFDGLKTGEKGYYNASNSISDSSAPLYYTNASRLSKEKKIAFEMDGFTKLNDYGFLNNAGVPKKDIMDYMNSHLSKLDFQGKSLPKAYLDKNGEVQIPNLLIKKFLQGGSVKSYQDGGIVDQITSFFNPEDTRPLREQEIEPLQGKNTRGKFIVGEKPVDDLVQYFNNDGTYSVKGLDEQILNNYRSDGVPDTGYSNEFNIFDSDYNEHHITQNVSSDEKGKYVDLSNEDLFKGQSLSQRVYFPSNFEEQQAMERKYQDASFAEDSPMGSRGEEYFESGKDFMTGFVKSDNYLNMLRPYYDDPEEEQKLRLSRARNVEGVYQDHKVMGDSIMGYTTAPGERVNVFGTSSKFDDHDDFDGTGYYNREQVKEFKKDGSLHEFEDTRESNKVFLSNKQTGDASVHEISHNIKTVPKSQYKDIFNRVKRTGASSQLLDMGDGKTFKAVDYLTEPTEVISRLDTFRHLMMEQNIKDQRKDPQYNESDLIKAFDNKKIKGDFNVKQLIQSTTSSQDLLWLLNNIVNNTKDFKNSDMA